MRTVADHISKDDIHITPSGRIFVAGRYYGQWWYVFDGTVDSSVYPNFVAATRDQVVETIVNLINGVQ